MSLLKLLQARLELALGYTPNWILSPTRLPIPPLEQISLRLCVYLITKHPQCQTENLLIYLSISSIRTVKSDIMAFRAFLTVSVFEQLERPNKPDFTFSKTSF